MSALSSQAQAVRQYLIVTGNYWAFTLTDGALRMLVLLYFHQLGYSPLQIASLFLFYEFFGVVTNLLGGWLGSRIGLNKTMNIGLGLQIAALAMLLVPTEILIVPWVMAAQALSGIAKDLNKMSAKSAVKFLVPADQQSTLYVWVARLTGSKNTLKGIGFFLGGALLTSLGFRGAVTLMAVALSLVWIFSLLSLQQDLGKASYKPKLKELLAKSRNINYLSAARLFLFSARDVWFVVALPVFLSTQLAWSHLAIGAYLATWIIFYGLVQTFAPNITGRQPSTRTAFGWVAALTAIPAAIAFALLADISVSASLPIITIGLLIFGFVFAINSAVHSYLIVRYANEDGVSMDVGFYYMANAMGRLMGTLLSGAIYQFAGLSACLFVSSGLLIMAALFTLFLPRDQ